MTRIPALVATLFACAAFLPAAAADNVVELNVGERLAYLHVYTDPSQDGAPRADAEAAGIAAAETAVQCDPAPSPATGITCDTPSAFTLNGGETPASTGVQCESSAPSAPAVAFCGASVAAADLLAGAAAGSGPIPGLFLYGCTFPDPTVPQPECHGLRAQDDAPGQTCFYYWQRTAQGEDQLFLRCLPLP